MGTLGYINEFSSKALLRKKHQFSHNYEFKNCFCEVLNHLNITNFEIVVGFEECLPVEISSVLSFPSTSGVSWEDWEGGFPRLCGRGAHSSARRTLDCRGGRPRLRLCVCLWMGGAQHTRPGQWEKAPSSVGLPSVVPSDRGYIVWRYK